MKFYTLNNKLWNRSIHKTKNFPTVNGKFIKNSSKYFGSVENPGAIRNKNILNTSILLDYFILWDLTDQRVDDWIYLDLHGFSGSEVPIMLRGYLISEKLKLILEGFKIAGPTRFYRSLLKYKEDKLDYFLFQMSFDEWIAIELKKSSFNDKFGNKFPVKNKLDQKTILKKWKKNQSDFKLQLCLQEFYDIFYIQGLGFIISEPLKNAIKESEMTGIEIKEINNIHFSFINISRLKEVNITLADFCGILNKIQIASLHERGEKELKELLEILKRNYLYVDKVKVKNNYDLQKLIDLYDSSIKISEL